MNIDANFAKACRYVSKSGSLTSHKAYWLQLAEKLTEDEIVEVYCILRDESGRLETEWRGEFNEYFPRSIDLLPPVRDQEFWQDELFGLIRAGDLSGIDKFLKSIKLLDQDFVPSNVYRDCCEEGLMDGLSRVPFDFYPVEEKHNGMTPIELAISLQHFELAEYLKNVIDTLSKRFLRAYEIGRAEHHN